MNIRKHRDLFVILNSLGSVMIIAGMLGVIPLIVSVYYKEDIQPFLLVSVLPSVIGTAVRRVSQGQNEIQTKHATIAAALTYLMVSLIGMIPFSYYGMGGLDAFFEAMSGWTTTGLTMMNDVEIMPKSLLFWRSYTQWLGGVGIIVLLLAVLSTGRASARLYQAEARKERIKPRLISTARLIWWIYIAYTGMGIILFYLAGMNEFDAVNHAMTAISTGGFSVKNASLEAYDNMGIEVVAIMLMLLGGMNFVVHYKFFTGERGSLSKDLQVRATIVSTLLITVLLISYKTLDFRSGLFQSVSAITTTGFSSTNITLLDDFSKSVLTLLMAIGASAGSTGGALKIIRIVIIFKLIYWWIRQSTMPEHAVITRRVAGIELEPEMIHETTVYSLMYIIILGASGLALMFLGYSGTDAMFEVASAQGNVGLSSGITGAALEPAGKILLIFNMWIGRLEIIPVLALIQTIIGRGKT